MHVDVVLVTLLGTPPQLTALLHPAGYLPRRSLSAADDPDRVARALATATIGTDRHVARQAFFRAADGEAGADLRLLYRQLLPDEAAVQLALDVHRVPVTPEGRPTVEGVTAAAEADLVASVVTALRQELREVMHAREHKRGLVHLLQLLPEVFDHKELQTMYAALTGEKPASAVMLARMMLDKYTVGSGEKAREVRGRNLIREIEGAPPEVLNEKWEKNKELYRKGGPKAKRLYKQLLPPS